MNKGKIQFITDGVDSQSVLSQVETVVSNGINWVQFRMKNECFDNKVVIGEKIKHICAKYDATFIINDDVQLAKVLQADGVHLGLGDMNPLEAREILGENAIIGATCNTIEDIRLRYQQGVDYVGLGPFRYTTTKKNLSPILGLEGYNSIISAMRKEGIDIPVVSIGGIRVDDIKSLMGTGIHGVAISSLITTADCRQGVINKIISAIN